jgi:uncharacterized membrane protein SirB2
MALIEHYPLIKGTHVGLALLSGSLFAARGVGVLLGSPVPMVPWIRRGCQVVDSALLAAALLLLAALRLDPFVTPWLLTKLGFLIAYIVLGMLALGRAPSRTVRALAYIAALTCFAMIVAIARAHDPLGLLRLLQGH